jgi:hypothetical protein
MLKLLYLISLLYLFQVLVLKPELWFSIISIHQILFIVFCSYLCGFFMKNIMRIFTSLWPQHHPSRGLFAYIFLICCQYFLLHSNFINFITTRSFYSIFSRCNLLFLFIFHRTWYRSVSVQRIWAVKNFHICFEINTALMYIIWKRATDSFKI